VRTSESASLPNSTPFSIWLPIADISERPKEPLRISLIAFMPVMRITAFASLPVVEDSPSPS
jgi:hypothetical protein